MSFISLLIICLGFCFLQDGGPAFAVMLFIAYVLYHLYGIYCGLKYEWETGRKPPKTGIRKLELESYYDYNADHIKNLRKRGNYVAELNYMLKYENIREELIDYYLYDESDEIKKLRKEFEERAMELGTTYAELVREESNKLTEFWQAMLKHCITLRSEKEIKRAMNEGEQLAKEENRPLDEVAAKIIARKYDKYIGKVWIDEEDIIKARKEYEEDARKIRESDQN